MDLSLGVHVSIFDRELPTTLAAAINKVLSLASRTILTTSASDVYQFCPIELKQLCRVVWAMITYDQHPCSIAAEVNSEKSCC